MVDVRKIKSLMGANDHTRTKLAKVLKISSTALSNKLDSESEFKASELKRIAELYNVKVDELYL